MRRKVNVFMITFMCAVEFLLSAADALGAIDLDGMALMMIVLVQLYFIIQEELIEEQERHERRAALKRKKQLIERSLNDGNSRRA